MIRNGVCCFTGHRDFERTASPREILIFEKLVDNLIRYGYTTFVAGGALGFDTVAAEYILIKRAEGIGVRLELMLPCADQAARWSPNQRRRYEAILSKADSVEILHEHYTKSCMHERNRRMVEKSSACVAYCKQNFGGTFSTVCYARSRGIMLYNIAEMNAKM